MENNEQTPRGRTNFWIGFAGLDATPNSSGAVFRFDFGDGEKIDGIDIVQGTISFPVEVQKDGMNGMMARAHKQLGDILRKFLHTADMFEENYKQR